MFSGDSACRLPKADLSGQNVWAFIKNLNSLQTAHF